MSRTLQLTLNGKALARDISRRKWGKILFHSRGLLRAILPVSLAAFLSL